MAQHKSAIKRARQNAKRNIRNRTVRSGLRTFLKNYRALLGTKDVKEAESGLAGIHKQIDKAVTKGILHRRTASRYKSRLAVALGKLKAA
ncbi:MAG: 30S ribosomal protein S20 [Deltaproteobacteria bacterium]|nr:30S ribosomal protein S20 [Deltaproteobacteria bacterium]